MNTEALHQLRRVAMAIPPAEINMGTWGDEDGEICGTAACLAGWARRDAWFREHTSIAEIVRDGWTEDFADLFEIPRQSAETLFALKKCQVHATPADLVLNIDLILDGRSPIPYRQEEQ